MIAVIVSIALALGLIGVVGAVIFGQLSDLAHQLPQYERALRQHITHLRGFMRGGITDSLNGFDRLTSQIQSLSPLVEDSRRACRRCRSSQAPANMLEISGSWSARW